MHEKKIVDYIIVGMGLAGSAIAIQLTNAGKKIAVIDDPSKNNSTRIAAGLFNPITGNKLGKTWLADTLFPYLHEFYHGIEKISGVDFFYPMPLYRPFVSIEEQNEWMGRTAEKDFESIIEQVYTTAAYAEVHNPFGGLLLKNCGYINTIRMLNAVKTIIERSQLYLEGQFKYEKLSLHTEYVVYEQVKASKIIFCEGHHVANNPWFKNLPVKALKGETLMIKSPWDKHVILNRGVYIVPSANKFEFKVGSTYNFQDKTPVITQQARVEIEQKMNDLINFPCEIVTQEWGMRPTTPDRRPILGEHPEEKKLIIFNGLGTKGVSLAPYFSKVLTRWLEMGEPLNKEVDVTRFKSVILNSAK